MKYRFEQIENGQIVDGYTVIQIVDHEAEISDEAAILLAEKHGGELVQPEATPKPRKTAKVEPEGGTN